MIIIARESFSTYGEKKTMLFKDAIADIPDDHANMLIREGKAYKYSFQDGIDYEYNGTDDEYTVTVPVEVVDGYSPVDPS